MEDNRYRSKSIVVTAWQFREDVEMPVWVVASASLKKDGKLLFKRGSVFAVEPNATDWLVRDSVTGIVSIFTAEEFARAFDKENADAQ